MPEFILRNCATSAAYPNQFSVILTMDDGYELGVGSISEAEGRATEVFWSWSCPGANGREATREAAMMAFKAAWRTTDQELAELRRQQEWTANKYALWDAGYRDQVRLGVIRCPCGESFDPKSHQQTMAHIDHIKAAPNRGNSPP